MDRNKYWSSKVPVPLALLFVVNVFLVMALEILLFYRYPADLTAADLAAMNPAYENCTIIASDDVGTFRCWLVKLESGDYAMVPARQHGLASSRAKVYKNQITSVSAETEEVEITVRTGVHSSLVSVSRHPNPYDVESLERYLYILYHGASGGQGALALYMLIAAVLEGMELSIWHLIRQQ